MNKLNEIVEKEPLPAVDSEHGQELPVLGELYLAGPVLPICSPSLPGEEAGQLLRRAGHRVLRGDPGHVC